MVEYSNYNKISCHQAELLMALYMENVSDITVEERVAFYAHLRNCPQCAREYKESKLIIGLIKKFWVYENEKQIFLEGLNNPIERERVIDEGWQDILERCPDLALSWKQQKRLRLLQPVGVIAVCLAIGIYIFLTFSIYSKLEIAPKSIHQQVALAPKPSVRIELVSKSGNILIPANQQIVTNDELKTLIINCMHSLKMNTNTVLAVKPLVEHSNIGCQIKLVSGQIYTHVQHDGNPFIVDTACGKAVITGTTFDIKATEDSTTLVVSEGTIQFESKNGVVNVAAGQRSEIVGQFAPSIPVSCNTDELTAWATGCKSIPALAQAGTNDDDWYLTLSLRKDPIVLAETDYDYWVEQKRDWFKQEFPWIFQLKDVLAKEGVEADYPELLLQSSDVWQFVCLDVLPARFSVLDTNSLLRVASDYGFDKQWLLENVTAVKCAIEKPVLPNNAPVGLKAFEQWLKYLDETNELKPPKPIYSFHASKYLTETRSLIWFAVRDGKYELTDEEQAEVLFLLQEEVAAASQCQNDELYLVDKQKPSSDEMCENLVGSIVGYIKTMKAVEERIVEYEIR